MSSSQHSTAHAPQLQNNTLDEGGGKVEEEDQEYVGNYFEKKQFRIKGFSAYS